MKLTIAEIDKHLFPERYPYFKNQFAECIDCLHQYDKSESDVLNVSFLVKLTKYSLSINVEEHRILCSLLFDKIVDHYYDRHQTYNWHELKLLLMFFIHFSKAKTLKEINGLFCSESHSAIIKKYKPK